MSHYFPFGLATTHLSHTITLTLFTAHLTTAAPYSFHSFCGLSIALSGFKVFERVAMCCIFNVLYEIFKLTFLW